MAPDRPQKTEPNLLGLDHPLLSVRDLDAAERAFTRMGFTLAPRSHHPWGTSNHLVMFARDFIEIIGVGDASRIDMPVNAAGFAFGRAIADFLERREGVSMVALHSEDGRRDFEDAVGRGAPGHGIVDFRRAVDLGDGGTGEAVVTLGVFWNGDAPNTSTFLCHQHRPELIWVPAWQKHPNGVDGIVRVTYCAEEPDALRGYLASLWGARRLVAEPHGLKVRTPNGQVQVVTPEHLARRFDGVHAEPPATSDLPCAVAIRLRAPDLDRLADTLIAGEVPFAETDEIPGRRVIRVGAEDAAGTILEFTDGKGVDET